MSSGIEESLRLPFLFTTNANIKDFCEDQSQDLDALLSRLIILEFKSPISEKAPKDETKIQLLQMKQDWPRDVPFHYSLRPKSKIGGETLLHLFQTFFESEDEILPLDRGEKIQKAPWNICP